jgi:hypothetical protein
MRPERRRSRDSLTRALARIAGRIAATPSCRVEWNDRRLYSRETATVTAKALWVAGSYARGAAECGDLDLIMEAVINGTHPSTRTIAKGLYGSAQDTTLYIGTPDRNSSNVTFPEARLLWSTESPDWNANLAAIALDPEAGRFARPTDALPLRPDQVSSTVGELERLLELKASRVLDWEFVQADQVTVDPGALGSAGVYVERYGARTREALGLAIAYHTAAGQRGEWARAGVNEPTRFRAGGTLFLTGHPAIPIEELDSPACDLLMLVPHRSRRGPNGIWLIRRGPEHPVERLFVGCRAYYVTMNREPMLFVDVTHSKHHGATGIELFRSEDDALDHAEETREFVGDHNCVEVASAGGGDLLRLTAGCDMVLVDWTSFALSRAGELAIQADMAAKTGIAAAAEVAAALRPSDGRP